MLMPISRILQQTLIALMARCLGECLIVLAGLFWSGLSIASSSPNQPTITLTGAYSARFVQDMGNVAVIELSGNYDRVLANGTFNVEPRVVIAKEFFRAHPDAYDMLVVFTGFEIDTGVARAFFHSAQNKVKGIGRPEFDSSGEYGSSGRLKGMIDMAAVSRYAPSPLDRDFDQALGIFSHEFLHQFGSYVRFRKQDGSVSSELLGVDGAHWSYLLHTEASVHYGSRWRDNGDGTFTAQAVSKNFSPLDLYLMGFKPASAVAPFFLIDSAGTDPRQLPFLGATINGTKRTITIDDIIAAEGPRIPDSGAAQRDYRVAFIYVVRPGQNPSPPELAAVEGIRQAIGTRFSALTDGQANINVLVEPRPSGVIGVPVVLPPPVSPPAVSLNLGQGLSWLRSRQQPDGKWTDTSTTGYRDSAVVLNTLRELDGGFSGIGLGIGWLDSLGGESTDYLARSAIAFAGSATTSFNRIIDRLLSSQNADGGWGAAAGYASNPLDSALATQALGRRSISADSNLDRARAFLRESQNSDGGWGSTPGGASRTTTSSHVLMALRTDPLAASQRSSGIAFLAGKQNSDGGFGDSPSSVHDTAAAINSLISLNATAAVRSEDAVRYLGSAQRTDGSWLGSVYSTSVAVAALSRFDAMNWAVTALAATPQSVADGERVLIRATITNTGNKPAPAGKIRIVEGQSAETGTPIGPDVDFPALAAGAAFVVSTEWNTLGKSGTRILHVLVDPNATQSELSRTDNVASVTVQVGAPATGLDLLIGASDVTTSPAVVTQLPASVTISALITNAGSVPVSNVVVSLWQGEAGARFKVGDVAIASFPARSTRPVSFVVELSQASSRKFTVEIDPDRTLPDVNRENNSVSIILETSGSADIEVLSTDITMSPASPRLGDDITFSFKVRNKGTVEAGSFILQQVISGSAEPVLLPASTLSLAGGQEVTRTATWRATTSGSLTFGLAADPGGLIAESNEGNNQGSLNFTVVARTGPSLVVSFSDVSVTPNPLLAGKPAEIRALIRNVGNEPVSNVEVSFHDGDPAAGGVQIGTVQTIPSLAAGGQAQLVQAWVPQSSAAARQVFVVVDPRNIVTGDVDRQDNKAFVTVPTKRLPDLSVTQGSLAVSPAPPRPGQPLTLTLRVDNLGEQPTGAFAVRVFDGAPAGGVVIAEELSATSIGAAESRTLSFAWTLPDSTQRRQLHVVVDAVNSVEESNENNNAAMIEVLPQSGDFIVSASFLSPNGDGRKDSVEFSYRLPAAEAVRVRVQDAFGNLVRLTAGSGSTASSGRFVWDGRSDAGVVVMDGPYTMQAINASGAVLGQATVTVDNNRSSLFEALDTQFGSRRHLVCQSSNDVTGIGEMTLDGSAVYFLVADRGPSATLPEGVYRADGSGSELRQVLPRPSGSGSRSWTAAKPSEDGLLLALVEESQQGNAIWLASSTDGSGLRRLSLGSYEGGEISLVGFTKDNASLLAWVEYFSGPSAGQAKLIAIPIAEVGSTHLLYSGPSFAVRSKTSPDGRHVAIWSEGASEFRIVNIISGANTLVSIPGTDNELGYRSVLSWSPDSLKVATMSRGENRFANVFSLNGTQLGAFGGPDVGGAAHIVWGRDSAGLLVSVPHLRDFGFCGSPDSALFCDGDRKILEYRLQTGAVTEVVRRSVVKATGSEGGDLRSTLVPLQFPNENALLILEGQPTTGYTFVWNAGLLEANGSVKPLPGVAQDLASAFVSLSSAEPGVAQAVTRDFDRVVHFYGSEGAMNCEQSISGPMTYRSLLNLTAQLGLVRDGSHVRLTGTASDLNFAKYQLDYQRVDTSIWISIDSPSTTPVTESTLGRWTPPGPGSYLVRLTVEDMAGNQQEAVRRINWGANAIVANLSRAPTHISPNGDGVQESSRLSYLVVEPSNIEIGVFSSSGERVRRVLRSHPVAGIEVQFDWDGRNDAGFVVPDGEYKLRVLENEFAVFVDTVPPKPATSGVSQVQARIARMDFRMEDPVIDARAESANPLGDSTVPVPRRRPHHRIDWAVEDAHFKDIRIQRRDLSGGGWASAFEGNVANARRPYQPFLVPHRDVGKFAYRVVATDLAGNQVIEEFALPQEWLKLVNLRAGVSWAEATTVLDAQELSEQPLQIEVAETVRPGLSQWKVEWAGPLQPGQQAQNWTTSDITLPPGLSTNGLPRDETSIDGALTLTWRVPNLRAAGEYVARLSALDSDGRQHVSDQFAFKSSAQFDLTAEFESPSQILVRGRELLGRSLLRLDIMIRSDEDAAFTTEQSIWSRPGSASPAGIGPFEVRLPGQYRSCAVYQLRLRATFADGGSQSFSPIARADYCTFTQTIVMPVVAACGATPARSLIVEMRPLNKLTSAPLTLLEFARRRSDGTDDVLFSRVNPGVGTDYTFQLSTIDMPEGKLDRTYFTRLTDATGNRKEEFVKVVVDRTPPTLQIGSPTSGAKICARPFVTSDGRADSRIDIEGAISDSAGADYIVEVGRGESPTSFDRVSASKALGCVSAGNRTRPLGARFASNNSESFREPDELGADKCGPFESLAVTNLSGPLAAIGNAASYHGTVQARVSARDWGGHQVCSSVVFNVDALVERVTPVLRSNIVSQLGADGRVAQVGIEPLEQLVTTALVYRKEDVSTSVNGTVSIATGAILVRRLHDRVLTQIGPAVLEWNGLGESSQPVADGAYYLMLSYEDACGNRAAESPLEVFVDGKAPSASISSPAANASVSGRVAVLGTASDANLSRYVLEYGQGADPQTWIEIASGTESKEDELLGTWNAFGLPAGAYVLRLRVVDRAGNSRDVSRPLELAESGNLALEVVANPEAISPNEDGRADSMTIQFTLSVAASVNARIERAGATVATLATAVDYPAGSHRLTWGGRNSSGQIVQDGDYSVVLNILADGGATQFTTLPIVVDLQPPQVSFASPAGSHVRGSQDVQGTASDANLATYRLELVPISPPGPTIEIAQSARSVTTGLLGRLEGLPEGSYQLRLFAEDKAQNRSESGRTVTVDNTPPKLVINSPTDGAVVGMKSHPMAVRGSIDERHFKLFRVSLGQGSPPANFAELSSSSQAPASDVLHVLDIGSISEGPHTLRVQVEDLAGWIVGADIPIVVDKTAPMAVLVSPVPNAFIRSSVDIIGTATDANLLKYRLEISPGPPETANRFSELSAGTSGVSSAQLGRLSALPPDGVHTLRLAVEDKAGNITTASSRLTVDTLPPGVPTALTARAQGRDVRLTWTAMQDGNLAGYLLYRNGQRISTHPVVVTEHVDAGLVEGNYRYAVSAVDLAGNESSKSVEVEVVVSLSAPTATISAPQRNSAVSALVDVRGTASANTGLKEYRLLLAPMASSPQFQLIKRSPAPVLAGSLGTFDSRSLHEGAIYLIKLEVEDVSGQIGSEQIEILVDNTAPSAPQNLTALVQSPQVTLTWIANAEADLDGYLLYRGNRLVNQVGDSIADLRAYLIRATSYTDANVVDGQHDYSVVAMDKAGNVSQPSASRRVSIDSRPPSASIAQPAPGARVDKSVYVLARSSDEDIAQVQLQYRALPAGAWTNLGGTITSPPYGTTWNLEALAYGEYELRAVATDLGGRVDPAAATVTISHERLSKPTPPTNAAVRVDGSTVSISWTASVTSQLAGYVVERRDTASGDVIRLTETPVAGLSFVDSNVPEGLYVYGIRASESGGVESDPAETGNGRVYSLGWEQPLSPTHVRTLGVQGTALPAWPVTLTFSKPSGSQTFTLSADPSGAFNFGERTLEPGSNYVELVQVDGSGNRSIVSRSRILIADRPEPPTGLSATVSGDSFTTSWTASASADVAGYFLKLDGDLQAITESQLLTGARSSTNLPELTLAPVIDGDFNTAWRAAASEVPQWIEIRLAERALLSGIEIQWEASDANLAARAYRVQGWDGEVWVNLARVRENDSSYNTDFFETPYFTDRLRIAIDQPSQEGGIGISDVQIKGPVVVPQSPFELTGYVGNLSVTAVAFSSTGLVSIDSQPVSVSVGDTTPPGPVVLQGVLSGRDVDLSWTASPSANISQYEVLRNDVVMAIRHEFETRTFQDAALPNGTYRYSVVPINTNSVRGARSNEVVIAIQIDAVGKPRELAISAPPAGRRLVLSWLAPSSGAAVQFYRVQRAADVTGPFVDIGAPTSALTFTDDEVENGRIYFYRVLAYNDQGAGPASEVVSGTPLATLPTAQPTLVYPASASLPAKLATSLSTVFGFAEPGSRVLLRLNGIQTAAVDAVASIRKLAEPAPASGVFSPDGARMLSTDSGFASLYAVRTTGNESSVVLVRTSPLRAGSQAAWNREGNIAAFASPEGPAFLNEYRLVRVDAQTGAETLLPTPTLAGDGVALDATGNNAFVIAKVAGVPKLARVDLRTGAVTPIAGDVSGTESLSISPNDRLMILSSSGSGLRVVDLSTGATTAVSGNQPVQPSWSPESDGFVYLADVGSLRQVFLYSLASAQSEQLTSADVGYVTSVSYAPDGKRVAYAASNLSLINLVDDSRSIVSAVGSVYAVNWLASGHLATTGDLGRQRIQLPGHFVLPEVVFPPGTSTLTAIARDGDRAASSPSLPVSVTYSTADRPDLVITAADMMVLPAVPLRGESVRITFSARNAGVLSSTTTMLVARANAPDGTSAVLSQVEVPALAPGQTFSVSADWIPQQAGAYQLNATVDPADVVPEISEQNNAAVKTVVVAGSEAPQLRLTVAAPVIPRGGTLSFSAIVTNGGPLFSGKLKVRVEDSQGFLVTELADELLSDLEFGATRTIARSWQSGSTLAGNYRVSAKVLDSQDREVATAVGTFEIEAPINVTATVSTDRMSYQPGGRVLLRGRAAFGAGSGIGLSGQAVFRVVDALGSPRMTLQRDIALGVTADLEGDWIVPADVTGSFSAVFEIRREGQRLAEASAAFSVTAPAVANPAIRIVAPVTGAVIQSGATIEALVEATPGTDAVVSKVEFFIGSDKVGERTQPPFTMSISSLPPGNYSLGARVQDSAGRQADAPSVSFRVNALPTVSITSPVSGAAFTLPASISITAVATDPDSTVASIQILAGSLALGQCSQSPCTIAWNSASPGTHLLSAVATDSAGGRANSTVMPIVVSAEAAVPTVAITAPLAEAVIEFGSAVTIEALATSSQAIRKVEFFADGERIGEDVTAPYSMEWTPSSAARFQLTARVTDVADRTVEAAAVPVSVNARPTVQVTTPSNGAKLNPGVSLSISVTAADPEGALARIEVFVDDFKVGECTSSPCVVPFTSSVAGQHSVRAKATDAAGFSADSAAVTFITNAPPVATITSPADGTVVQVPGTVAVSAIASDGDGNITRLEILRGEQVVADCAASTCTATVDISSGGAMALRARATDDIGLTATSATVSVVLNAAPSISVQSPVPGTRVTVPASVQISIAASDSDDAVSRIDVLVGSDRVGECTSSPCVVSWAVTQPGSYSITAKAHDSRGGSTTTTGVSVIAEAPLSPPSVSLLSPTSGSVFTSPAVVNFTAEASTPNAGGSIARVEFHANGQKVGEALAAPYAFSWSANAQGQIPVFARAVDDRGISTDSTIVNIRLNARPTLSLTSPTPGTTLLAPGTVTLTAAALDVDGSIATIELYRAGTLLKTCTASPCSTTVEQLAQGTYEFSAKATDDLSAVSETVSVSVVVGSITGQLALTPSTANVGDAVAARAELSSPVALADLPGTIRVVTESGGAVAFTTNTAITVSTSAPFVWLVSIPTQGFAAGNYRVEFVVIRNGVSTVLATTPLTIQSGLLVSLAASLKADAKVLALVSCPPGSASSTQCAEDRKRFLADLLTELGIPNKVVTDVELFRTELRCGAWNTIWLAGGRDKLRDQLVPEIGQHVLAGNGLIVDGIHDNRNNGLDDILGVQLTGSLPANQAYSVVPQSSHFGTQAFQIEGKAQRFNVTRTGSTVLAAYSNSGANTAAISSAYGDGQVVFVGFDWIGSMLATVSAETPVPSILSHAGPRRVQPGSTVNVTLEVRNAGGAGSGEVRVILPAGFSIAGADPAPNGSNAWTLNLAANAVANIRITLQVGQSDGVVRFESGTGASLVSTSLTIPVGAMAGGSHDAVVAALNALSLNGGSANARNRAVTAVNQSKSTAANSPETSLYHLLTAAAEIESITSAGAVRIQLARLVLSVSGSVCQQLPVCLRPEQGSPTLSGYQLLVFGAAQLTNGNAEGAVGVAGSAQLASYSVGSQLRGDAARLVVGGSLSWGSGSVGLGNSGVIRVGGSMSITQSVGRRDAQSGVATDDWNSLRTYYQDLSTTLGGQVSSAPLHDGFGKYTFRGTSSTFNAFTISATQLRTAHTLLFDVPIASTVVVNVTGTSVTVTNGQQQVMVGGQARSMQGHELATRTLFNFHQATAMSVSSWSMQGTLLAPRANVTYANASLFGQAITNNLSSSSVGFQQCGTFKGVLSP